MLCVSTFMPAGKLIALLACLLLLVCAAPRVRAQTPAQPDARAPVRPGAQTTYLDLIRLVLPAADFDREGRIAAPKTIEVRDLFGDEAPGAYEGEITLADFDKLWLRDGAHTRLCLLLNLTSADSLFTWGELHVMALYEVEPRPRLLDAVAVQSDRFAGLWSTQPTLAIGPQRDAALVANSHFNSSQGYLQLTLITIEHNRLAAVFNRATLERANDCGHTFAETLTFSALPRPHTTHYPLRLRARLQLGPDDAGCTPRHMRTVTRHYQTILVWRPKKLEYADTTNGLAPLAKFDTRF
jgi:hypothetical protein